VGTKTKRRDRCEQQAADYGAAERRVLLATRHEAMDIGNMPMTIASAVINTGRKRVKPDREPLQRRGALVEASRAKLTTRILLAVATPIHMMAPVRAGTSASIA